MQRILVEDFVLVRTIMVAIAICVAAPILIAQQAAIRLAPGDTLQLSIETARSLAFQKNPDLAVARLDIDIARGQLRQAGTIKANPSLDILATGTGGNRPELALSQEIEIGGQSRIRRRGAQAELTRTTLTTADATRLIFAEVDRAFYQTFAAGRRAELSQEILALNERLSDVARRQLREGEISKLDYNLAVIELGRSRARGVAAVRGRDAAELELRRLLALDRQIAIKPLVDSTHRHVALDSTGAALPATDLLSNGPMSLAELIARALGSRPDLRARDALLERATNEAALARRERLPNLALRIVTEGAANGSGTAVRPGVGFTLPVLNRNRGEIDARHAAVKQAEANRVALSRLIRAEVEAAVRSYNAAATEVEMLESTVLTPARENRQLLEAAYREGKVGLPVLLLIRNQVIDAEQEYWSAWLAEREALAAITAAIGDTAIPSPTRVP